MSNSLTKSLIIILLAFSWCSLLRAQPKDNSPFSRFGIGDYFETNLPSQHSMGGLGSVYHDFFEANLDNPSSLGFLQYTTLQLGFYAKRSEIKRFNDKQRVWSGNMDHFSLNIPIINPLNEALERRETKFAWGTSVSLRPYSQVGYHIKLNDSIPDIGNITRDFKGSGGIYQFTIGNGWKYKNLSLGVNLTYLYGKQAFDENIVFNDLENPYEDIFTSTIAYKGFKYRLGGLYEIPLDLKKAQANKDNPSKLLSAGFFYEGKSNFDAKTDLTQLAFNRVTNDIDTAYSLLDKIYEGQLPASWGIGVMYHKAGDFRLGGEYQSASWSDFRNDARPDTLKDTKRFGFGVSWIPDANSITSYFRRVEYRAGFYTKTDPRVIEGEQVKEYAFSLGASLPLIMQRNIAWVQFGLDYGHRSGGPNLSDNFVRGKVGLVFNDNAWFIRGKYN